MKCLFRFRTTLILLALLFASVNGYAEQSRLYSGEIVKSPADQRLYRSLTLSNGLKVMLISDPGAEQAAAAMDVHVGSGSDPVDRQGLAHYLEHMLFLGTEKYPQAGEYQEYITSHGGSNNAYTILDHTNYFFNITPAHFEGALDRFAQFFIAPLFNEEYARRERSIVDSEYQARKTDEGRRLWTARRVILNPEHPQTKFSVGSLATLADRDGDPVREDLVRFYGHYYHAPRMALAVLGSQSLDQLQAWVEEKFSAVPEGGEPYAPFTMPLSNASQRPVALKLKPLKDTRRLVFSFPVPSVEQHDDAKPAQFLSNLLGHEGEGSLLALLKSKSWANSLSAGLGYSDDVQASFDINIGLSEEGARHVEEIGSLLFSYVELIREKGVDKLYYEELKQLAELDFRFQEKTAESALVQNIAARLHRYPADEVLSAPYLIKNFRPDLVGQILARLTPDWLQLIIVDPQLQTDTQTQWYDVGYRVEKLAPGWLAAWRAAQPVKPLALPEPNPFIPAHLEMLGDDSQLVTKPERLDGVQGVALWHQTETRFGQPRAALYFTLRSSAANQSARDAVLTELYVKAVQESLRTYTYPAYLAGLEYKIYRHSRGLSVRIDGYSDRQRALLEKIVDRMLNLEIDTQRFELYRENIRQVLENSLKGRPSSRVISGVYDVLLSSSWTEQEKLDALATLDLEALEQHVRKLLEQSELLALSLGNVSRADSLAAGKLISRLHTSERASDPVRRARVRKLAAGQWLLFKSQASPDDSAVAMIYQGKSDSLREQAMTTLIGALIRTPYYQALRTEAQLGYLVDAFAFNVLDTPALGFSVQSNNHAAGDVVKYTLDFLEKYKSVLSGLPQEVFDATRAGLIARIGEEDKRLEDLASRDWAELDREAYQFDTRERLLEEIGKLDLPTVERYFGQLIDADRSAVLISYSPGNKSARIDLPSSMKTASYPSLGALREDMHDYF